ncbi:MAG: DUF1549 and DUF1553 domain-containing protein [Planctomycetia bacterium]|nr:DUF1549 and DUF1553 domain-containing protein [Planctomycetia bacterium]
MTLVHRVVSALALAWGALCPTFVEAAADVPSFRQDVMPVFFRAGCNAGGCHGASRGKDGFMLSLFGYDPKGDYFRITQEMVGRRVNVAAPETSLLLLKATGSVTHTGGKRFAVDSDYYRTLLAWIQAGAPDDAESVAVPVEITLTPERIVFQGLGTPVQSKVTARYSDGSQRDVTKLSLFLTNNPATVAIEADGLVKPVSRGDSHVFARFDRFTIGSEIIVLPEKTDFKWSNPPANNYIDQLVYDRLQKLYILPSELCDDETFLRRIYLDLCGIPPTVAEYRKFMADASPRKREALIDELLASEAFSRVWAGIWGEWVRLIASGYIPDATDAKAANTYAQWILKQFKTNRPFNEFVADQIKGRGSNLTDAPSNLYTMLVQDRAFRPKDFAANFAQLMTGIQMQCAECHNHPFDRWTMTDYYGNVSFFNGIRRKQGVQYRDFIIYNDPTAPPAKHIVDQRPVPATVLGGEAPVPPDVDQLEALAAWLTAPDNPHFSRNFANRIWAHFFVRGLVEPIDDMRISNPPTNGPLLDALAEKFAASGFNLRSLIRDICMSRVYQLSIHPNETNKEDRRQFSRRSLRRARADILLDSIITATDGTHSFRSWPQGTMAMEYHPRASAPTAGDPFLSTFGRSKRGSICACETRNEVTISQTLHLLVGDTMQKNVDKGTVVPDLMKTKKTPEEIIEELYIRALTRKPKPEELKALLALLAPSEKPDAQFYKDLFSSLLNSSEFMFNH